MLGLVLLVATLVKSVVLGLVLLVATLVKSVGAGTGAACSNSCQECRCWR